MPGSSAETTTRPPFGPSNVKVMSGSIATLRPTCFMHTSARAPPMEAPTAISMATFSLTDHSQSIAPLNLATFSRISVDGVPG